MSEELYSDGLGIAPGVMETIVGYAAKDVAGVASVGSSTLSGLRSRFPLQPAQQGIDVSMDGDEGVQINIHIDVEFGRPIPEIAADVRSAVAGAIEAQVGFKVAGIDVFVDGIRFAE